jgi:hypothetical protein
MDVIGNIQRYEMYGVLLPVCMVSVAVKAVYKYCSRVLECDSSHSQFFFFKTIIVILVSSFWCKSSAKVPDNAYCD